MLSCALQSVVILSMRGSLSQSRSCHFSYYLYNTKLSLLSMQLKIMEKIELVFIPSFGAGHLISMIEMGNLLMSRCPNLSATFIIIKMKGHPTVDTSSIITAMTSSDDTYDSTRIRFLEIIRDADESVANPRATFNFMNLQKPTVKEIVEREIISRSTGSGRLAGFILDMFCVGMLDMAKGFNVPVHVFFSSGASFIGLMWHLKTLQDEHGQNLVDFNGSDVQLDVPHFKNHYPANMIPAGAMDKEGGSMAFVQIAKMLGEVDGIAINTFAELESHAIEVLSEDEKTPPVYPVGPILNLKKEGGEKLSSDIIRWLDGQPSSSVIFLCFGSMGSFPEVQLKEIAYALEKAGKRFLWSLRRPSGTEKKMSWMITSDYEDPGEVLPEGFLERTAEIGRVIGWAPQVEVLSHEAVGGFVSHCGWNSVLETVWFGVPTATWPIQAEQNMNAFFMVKEVGLSVDVKMDYRQTSRNRFGEDTIVPATAIERALRELMDENSDEMRKRMKEMSDKSRTAAAEGGSSYLAVGRFVNDVIAYFGVT